MRCVKNVRSDEEGAEELYGLVKMLRDGGYQK